MTEHAFWLASRAAGTGALILASLSVAVGLLLGGRMAGRRGPELRALHEALSLAVLGLIVVHAGVLLADGFLKPSLADITIPFVSGYQRAWTTIGILSGWSLMVLGLSYYARKRIGVARWRTLHRFTALAWLAAIVHSIGEGTDSGKAWFLIAVGLVVVPALALLITRIAGAATRPAVAATTSRST
jgi:sulfoxide reductase heme-binding subunit YedZ